MHPCCIAHDQRTPLAPPPSVPSIVTAHACAPSLLYRASTEKMVQYLVSLGASNAKSDTNGNTASKLADRAGRRKSKEIIEGLPAAETPTPTPA